jgi:hypothetical protein
MESVDGFGVGVGERTVHGNVKCEIILPAEETAH